MLLSKHWLHQCSMFNYCSSDLMEPFFTQPLKMSCKLFFATAGLGTSHKLHFSFNATWNALFWNFHKSVYWFCFVDNLITIFTRVMSIHHSGTAPLTSTAPWLQGRTLLWHCYCTLQRLYLALTFCVTLLSLIGAATCYYLRSIRVLHTCYFHYEPLPIRSISVLM